MATATKNAPVPCTSDMTYNEFISWAVEILCDAVITGGFKELKNRFQYSVLQQHYRIMMHQGGFLPPTNERR